MTKREALNGKPYAGNPHVRFDEGEAASTATSRRGSLLYNVNRCVVLAAGVFAAAICDSASGAGFYLKSGATDWSAASSYCTDADRTVEATALPGSSDSVHVPAETFTFDSSTSAGLASLAAISNVMQIITSEGTVLAFDIPQGEVGIGCRIRYDASTDAGRYKSTLVKKGAGILSLLATESDSHLYALNLDVQGGGLCLSQGTELNQKYGYLKMASGTTLWTPCSASSASQALFVHMAVEEGALITNSTSRAAGHVFGVNLLMKNNAYDSESYIKGVIAGGARLWTVGSVRLEGTNNVMGGSVTVNGNYGNLYQDADGRRGGTVLVKKMGVTGEPSSIGTSGIAILANGSGGGGFRYIGEGETTDKNFLFYQPVYGDDQKQTSAYPAFLDGGPHGGLVLAGHLAPSYDSGNGCAVRRLWLTGENEDECVVAGGMTRLQNGGTLYPVFLTKSGIGTWRLADGPSCYHVGGTAILDGTLKFDSIDEKGYWSSLGDSSVLTADDSRAIENGEYVNYAFTLGGASGDPVFEYSGSIAAKCTTRPLVLAGSGGHLRASAGRLVFGDISARDAGSSPTLTLDGTGTGNVAQNIYDGAEGAKVNVVKDGTGDWTLAEDQTFTGDITVRQGTLSVKAPVSDKYADYKLFRLSIAKMGDGSNLMQIRQICLFDKDGVRQNQGLTAAGTSGSSGETVTLEAVKIGPGQVYYDRSAAGRQVTLEENYGDCGIASAFDGSFSGNSGRYCIRWKNADGTACSPSPSDRSTWIPIVMHLPDSANPITHFDIEGFPQTSGRLPTRICLEASHDGCVWEEVYSNTGSTDAALAANTSYYNQWISDSQGAAADNRPFGTGLTLSRSGSVEHQYFSWFRLSFAEMGSRGANSLAIRQICLYDIDGNRLNGGLVMAETPAEIGASRTVLATVPGPGQVGYGASAAGLVVKPQSDDCGELNGCFDGNYNGALGRCFMKWCDANGKDLQIAVRRRKSWIPIVMHLQNPVAVHHFDVQLYDINSLAEAPVRLMLEGSVDGESWYELYNNATKGEAFSVVPQYYNCWLSDGVSASNSNHARTNGTGIAVSSAYVPASSATQFPDGMSVQVYDGATLVSDADHTIKSLRVDAAGAGTIDGFTFAETGVLEVINAQHQVLPGTYLNCEGLENIASWKIKVDGEKIGKCRIKVVDGKIRLDPYGLTVTLR